MEKINPDSPVWLVTGCSTGFGREYVRAVLAHGFRVVATARDPKKLDDLIAGHEGRAIALPLDVTKTDQIKHAVDEAERVFGRIDVLVNNAGYGYMAAVEEGEEKNIRALFDTNFFGLAAMIRAVLPGMVCGHGNMDILSILRPSAESLDSPVPAIMRLRSLRLRDCQTPLRRRWSRWESTCWW